MRAWLKAVIAGAVLVCSLFQTAPAHAHTTLVDSDPPHRTVLDRPSDEMRLEFSHEVDPRLVSGVLLSVDGQREVHPPRLTPDRPHTTTIAFDVPALDDGTYGFQWRSVGPDGHEVNGEVIFAVGASAAQPAADEGIGRGTAPLAGNWVLATAAHLGRVLWHAGLVLLAGALFAAGWLRRRQPHPAKARPLVASVDAAGRWGSRLVVAGLGGGWIATVSLMSWSLTGVSIDSVRAALGSPVSVVGAVTVALALLLVVDRVTFERLAQPRTMHAVAFVLLAVVGLRVGVGHAARDGAEALLAEAGRIVMGIGHAAAAALWLGPIVVVAISFALARATGHDPVPSPLARSYLGDYARVAGWVFGVLLVTGVTQWATITGSRVSLDGYTAVIALKGLLVAVVVVPLGWYHHRNHARSARLRTTLRVEAVAGASVLVLGGVLAGVAPPTPPAAANALPASALGVEQVDDIGDCAELVVGRTDCYRSYFVQILQAEGAGAVLAAIDAARAQDPAVAQQCHQLTHDLGQEAAAALGLAGALAVDGSLCASGYYHGVVEASLQTHPDGDLSTVVPVLCDPVAEPRYSSVHYSCVHGVGHGLMLRSGLDLFASLPTCAAYTDPWERHSCWSGVFMENVVAVQEGHATGEFRADDLLYPCSAVEDEQKPACFSIHTGYLLWENGFDLPAAFTVCDQAQAAHVPGCYQSMGRDISGFSQLDPEAVIAGCGLGSAAWRGHCYAGAALDAVYTENGTAAATALCQAVPAQHQAMCFEARDQLAERL